MKFFTILLLLITTFFSLHAKTLSPTYTLKASGGVTDLVYQEKKLYVATTASKVNIFDINTKKIIQSITLPNIKDFTGEEINSKIYSVDVLDNKILILSQGEKGGRNIDIYENGKLTNIISDKKRLFIGQAKFINNKKIIFSLLSNQLYVYDIKQSKALYIKQISHSKFSHFALNEKRDRVIIADESGELKTVNLDDGHIIKKYTGYNLDNVFQVDWKNNIIITAGQDRRCVVYNVDTPYYNSSNFLIYSCGLTPKGVIGAYSSDEENNVTVFNTFTKADLYQLTGNRMTLSKILFINENELFISSDDKHINYYKLK